VQIGSRKVGEVEILKGISSGEMVITEGTQRIGTGSPVSIMTNPKKG
jgi:membrane fusion protein (multidrug efflux system)